MPPVPAPADKRFRRAHVKPSSRRRSRWHHAWLAVRVLTLCGLVAYAAWRGVALLATSTVLHVDHVTVTGNQRLSRGEVLALLDGLRGRHILGLDLPAWQQRLQASPWVARAALRRVLPATIEVRIDERQPLAIARIDRGLYLIDAEGVVLDEYGPAHADKDLPLVDGLTGASGRKGDVDPVRAALAARVIEALATRPDLADKVSQIDVSRVDDAVVMLEGDTALLRLGDTDFVERLQQYLDLSDALRERVAAIDYVDLRFSERLYVRPVKGSAVAPASSRTRR
jgi:cell division septal protein FtsQ